MINNKYRQVLEKSALNIPGLVLLGHNISSKASLPLTTHIHKDSLELVAVMKGNECYYVDNRSFELSGGDVFIAYENQPHRSGNPVQGVCEIIWIQINTTVSKNFLGLSKQFGELIKNQLMEMNSHVIKTDKESIAYLKKSFEYFLKGNVNDRLYAHSLFMSFLSKLLFIQNQFKREDVLIKNTLEYIDRNIYECIGIDDICTISNISLSGFKHKFKEYTGETPRNYINFKKIQKAKELLKSGKSVTETAMQLSFNTSDYFSVVFKKFTGSSPSKFLES